MTENSDAAPLWHGRFDDGPSSALWDFTVSLDYDQRLAPYDILGCLAHVEGLKYAGLLTSEEEAAIVSALGAVGSDIERGSFAFVETDEDIHTAIERRVTELCGDAGAKLHTARSRNDQVATAFKLYVLDAIGDVAQALVGLQKTLVTSAGASGDTFLPGFTHLQFAQPVMLGHHFLAHFWSLSRDLSRLADCAERANVSPLGAGALSGTSLPIDPDSTATLLGFDRPFENSLDAVSDRDFVAEALFSLALIGVHLSRIGEEIVLWSTEQFGFVTLDDQFSTGSSMLPQKKNPDIAELARGKTGRLIGNLTGLLVTLKGLPLAYNRDLQEDKEPLFDSADQVRLGLIAVSGMIQTMVVNDAQMIQAASSPFGVATDLAEYLVEHGMPFREAHAVVGEIVRGAIAGKDDMATLVAAHPKLGDEAAKLFDPGVSVKNRTSPGGGGPGPLSAQLVHAQTRLATDLETAKRLEARVPIAKHE